MTKTEQDIYGSEAIILHKEYLLFGVQKKKRWNEYDDKTIITIKTVGGEIENGESPTSCIEREISEEIIFTPNVNAKKALTFITPQKQYIEKEGVVREAHLNEARALAHVETTMQRMLSCIPLNNVRMHGTFFILKIQDTLEVCPNDLPALCAIPRTHIATWNFKKEYTAEDIETYLICSNKEIFPQNAHFVFMVPNHFHTLLSCV